MQLLPCTSQLASPANALTSSKRGVVGYLPNRCRHTYDACNPILLRTQLGRSIQHHWDGTVCQAADNQGSGGPSQTEQPSQQPQDTDSDLLFVGKLMATSFGVSAIIKWGSLLTPIPFNPNSAIAAIAILGPPAFYAARFLSLGASRK